MAWYRCGGTPSEVLSLPTPSEASGTIARFNTDLTENLLSAVAEFSASQASGTPTPSTPIPIVGVDKVNFTRCGINLWDEEWERGAYNSSGEKSTNTSYIRSKNQIPIKPNTSYYLKSPTVNGRVCYYDKNGTFISRSDSLGNAEFTTPANCYFITFFTLESEDYQNNISINYPATETAYHAYTGGTTALINLGGTYYGGYIDVVTGKITLTWTANPLSMGSVVKDGNCQHTYRVTGGYGRKFGNGNFNIKTSITTTYTQGHSTNSNIASLEPNHEWHLFVNSGSATFFITADSNYNDVSASDFKAEFGSVLIVYELATPVIVYASNTAEIPTIVGDNQVFCDTGDVDVTYFETVGHHI